MQRVSSGSSKNTLNQSQSFFPNTSTEEADARCLHLGDMNWHNILADPVEQGVLTAILE